jgi:hypothetical protein
MADHTQNISNTVNCLGQSPATRFGDANGFGYTSVFGTAKWSEGGHTIVMQVEKNLASEVIAVSGAYQGALVAKVLSNAVSSDFESDTESLQNGIWSIVFTSNTTDAEERDFASYTSGSALGSTFTCQAAGSTTWS